MRSSCLRPIPFLLALASLTLVACDDTSDLGLSPTGPSESILSPETPIPITSCGTVITQPGVYAMAADFGNGSNPHQTCPGPVVEIRVSNVTILSQGHGVDGNGGPCITAGVGVPGGVSHIRLVGVDLRSCKSAAIVFENVSSSVVANAIMRFQGRGIVIQGSAALSRADTVRNSSFSDNLEGGITVGSGTDFVISDNEFEGSQDFGFSSGVTLGGAVSHSLVRRNTFTGPADRIEVWGNRNTVVSNILQGNSQAGITVGGQRNAIIENRVAGTSGPGMRDYGSYNTLRGNTAENGGAGIEEIGRNGVIQGNTVQNNQGDGILVFDAGVRLTHNRVLNNGESGIHVFGNVGAIIAENTSLNNFVFDLLDDGSCGANTWRGNTFGTASAPCIQ